MEKHKLHLANKMKCANLLWMIFQDCILEGDLIIKPVPKVRAHDRGANLRFPESVPRKVHL
jgi:hypothetical protein